MTDKPEITRNDQTAIAFLKKIMDRLAGERQAYDARVQQAILTLSSFNTSYSMAYNQQSGVLGISPQQQAIAAQYGNGTPSHSHSIGISVPQWEPYLTLSEYKALKAWADGEDILIHLLTEER